MTAGRADGTEQFAHPVTSLTTSMPAMSTTMTCCPDVCYLGPDRAGNLLEVVMLERDDVLVGHHVLMHPLQRSDPTPRD